MIAAYICYRTTNLDSTAYTVNGTTAPSGQTLTSYKFTGQRKEAGLGFKPQADSQSWRKPAWIEAGQAGVHTKKGVAPVGCNAFCTHQGTLVYGVIVGKAAKKLGPSCGIEHRVGEIVQFGQHAAG